MRAKLASTFVLIAATTAFVAAPALAQTKTRHRVEICDSNVRKKANNGTAIGAVSGLIGMYLSYYAGVPSGTMIVSGLRQPSFSGIGFPTSVRNT